MNEEMLAMLREAERTRFWGSIEFEYRDGQVAVVRKTETKKILSRKGNNRDGHEENNYRR